MRYIRKRPLARAFACAAPWWPQSSLPPLEHAEHLRMMRQRFLKHRLPVLFMPVLFIHRCSRALMDTSCSNRLRAHASQHPGFNINLFLGLRSSFFWV